MAADFFAVAVFVFEALVFDVPADFFEAAVFVFEVFAFDVLAELFEFAVLELDPLLVVFDAEPFVAAAVFEPFAAADTFGSIDEAISVRNVLAPALSPMAAGFEIAETASDTASAAVEIIPLLGFFLDFDAVEEDFVPVLFLAFVVPADFLAELAADV